MKEAPAAQRARASQWLRLIASAPASIGLAVAVVVVAVASGADASGGWAASAEATLSKAQWWSIFAALFAAGSVLGAVVAVILSLSVLALAERALGTLRLCIAFLGGGVLAVIFGVFAEAGIARWPGLGAVDRAEIASPTIGIVVAIVAASGSASTLWRRRIRALTAAVVIVFALYSSDPASWVRLPAFALGLALSWRWYGAAQPMAQWSSSVDERRKLVSGFVALVGLGPLAGLLSGGGHGPIAHAAAVFSDVDRALVQRCQQIRLAVCDHETAAVVTQGLGLALLAAVPLALLIVAAVGLRTGRRAAWIVATATSALLAVAAITAALTDSVNVGGVGVGHTLELLVWGASAIGIPVAVTMVLLLTRRSFAVKAKRAATRRFALLVGISFVVLAASYLVASTLMRRDWASPPSATETFGDLVRRFLPQALLYDVGHQHVPHHGPMLFIWQWVGVIFWGIVIVGLLWLYQKARIESSPRRGDVIELLKASDAGTMAWPGTWDGVEHWVSADGKAAVSYRVANGVALAVSDPVCLAADRPKTLRDFVSFADERGLLPVFYGVHQDTADALKELGWQDMTVAEEAVLHVQTWSMAGKAGEKVRQPYTRMQREGVKALWTTWDELPARYSQEIRRISEEWVAGKALPEMGFTLGSIPEMQAAEVRLMLAINEADEVIGITSWLPSWTEGKLTGWTLDVMRRAPQAPNGVMEFLIASAAVQMKEEGIEVLSLSGAPLTTSAPENPDEEDHGFITTVLDRVSGALEPLYGFHSLFRFKKKFRPEHQRLAMSYADPLQLGTIGLAVARAYLPFASRHEAMILARGLMERGHKS